MERLEARMIANSRIFESQDVTAEEMRLFMKFLVNWRTLVGQSKAVLAAPPLPPLAGGMPPPTPSPEMLQIRASFEEARSALDQLTRISVEQGAVALTEAERIYRSSETYIIIALILTSLIVIAMLTLITWHEAK